MPTDLAFATEALDFHRAITVPDGPLAATRPELDALHQHCLALYALLDAHTTRTNPIDRAGGEVLKAARVRLWQAAEHLHAAWHRTPATDADRLLTAGGCRPRVPVCGRHLRMSVHVRHTHTPAELRSPFTGPDHL
ncbi:DUF6238 family protein [Streptomyces sp. NPDC059816]|uniref:DUF6238 family protein n=1 Tax=Streptomyces sp. NPDC059816 TaxID=3346960 RepID=UPI003668036A